MAEVVWSRRAIRDVGRITAYIEAQGKPKAALDVGRRLFAAGNSLADFPTRGRPIPETQFRELTLIQPYLIRYAVRDDRVRIVTVWHGARQRP